MLTPTDLARNLVPGSVAYANRKVLRELGCLAVEGLLACPLRMESGFIFSLNIVPVRASMPGSLLRSLNIIDSGAQEKERPDVCLVDLHSHGP